jgi:transcriptional antiterminator RfaH
MNDERSDDSLSWYVIRTRLNQEDRASRNLGTWNIETLAPKVKKRWYSQFTGEPNDVIRPLFARYIFARFKASEMLHKIRYTRGVQSVLNFGGIPTPVDESIIELLRSRMNKDSLVEIGDRFRPGDNVMIKDGPLKSFTGIFERHMNDAERVMILLETVSCQIHFEVSREQLVKLY